MDLPRITPILTSILSDPKTGMRRGGIRGIRHVLNTGIILSGSILIGTGTRLVTSMTRIFITATTPAGGRMESRVAGPWAPRGHRSRPTMDQGTTGPGYHGPATTGPGYSPSGTASPGYPNPREQPVRAIAAQEPRVLDTSPYGNCRSRLSSPRSYPRLSWPCNHRSRISSFRDCRSRLSRSCNTRSWS